MTAVATSKNWEQEIRKVIQNPKVNQNGLTFLESLRNRPELAGDLTQKGILLKTVLNRQRQATDYYIHAVNNQNQDPIAAQRDAEREFLLIPTTEAAPNLHNQENLSEL